MARPSSLPQRVHDLEKHFTHDPTFLLHSLNISPILRYDARTNPSALRPSRRQRIHRAWRRYCGP